MSETYVDQAAAAPPPEIISLTTIEPSPVRMLMGDELLRAHDFIDWRNLPNINPQAAPPLLGSAYTVTVANPTPPTNIGLVAYGTPPEFAMVPNVTGRGAPTYSDDAALNATNNLTVPTVGSITAIAAPTAGSSGPTSEATGTVEVVTAPGSVAAAPTQMISVQGNYTSTPNASHPSSLPQVQYLTPALPASTAAGGAGAIALTVFGHGFNSSSVVKVNAVAQTTVLVNSNTLTVAAAPRKATAGAVPVIVTTDTVDSSAMQWVFT